MDEILQKVKTALRIKHTALDADILDNIESCLQDLRIHGVVHAGVEDALIQNAIKLYCKTEYTDDPEKSEKYSERYREMRNCLKHAEGYGWVDGVTE
jgi:hypothetical protein